MSTTRKFQGVWIPADMWLDRALSITEKVMLVEIGSLQDDARGCYASNAHFAEFFGLSISRVSEIINGLAEKGFVTIQQIREGKRIIERQIRISEAFDKPNTPSEKAANPFGKGDEPPSEKAKESNTRVNNTGSNTPVAPSQDSPPEDAVITLPLNTGDEFPIYAAQVQEWKELFPAVDVIQQLRSMRAWLAANKAKRKTKTGIMRFATSWLSRDQDRGGSRPASGITRSSGFSERNYTNGIKETGNGDLTF